METTIEGNQFRTAEGRVATIDLGKALGLSDPLDANELVPEDEIETVMRLRTVPSSTAASAARRRGRDQLADHLERMGETSLQKTSESALDDAEPNPTSMSDQENPTNPVRQMLHRKIEEYDISQNLERGLLCFPELSHKLFGYSRDKTSRHKNSLEKRGIQFEENVRFPANNVTGEKRTAGVSEREFFRVLDRIDEEKADPEIAQLVRQKQQFSNEAILNPEKLRSQQPQVTVEPQIEVNPDVQLDTDDLADKIAKGIADSFNGHQELPGSNMTAEEMREEIHTILGPWKDMDDYNPWTDLYDEAVNRNSNSVAIRTYWRRKMDMDGSKLDAAEAMHRDPEYPPALRVLLDTAQQFFGG